MDQQLTYIQNMSILVRTIRGKATFSDIMCSWKDLLQTQQLTEGLNGVINDLRGVDLEMDVSHLNELVCLFKENSKVFANIKIAVLMDSPKTIVLPMMADKMVVDFSIRPFSTMDAAINWITDHHE